jgi:hypothetical protein
LGNSGEITISDSNISNISGFGNLFIAINNIKIYNLVVEDLKGRI